MCFSVLIFFLNVWLWRKERRRRCFDRHRRRRWLRTAADSVTLNVLLLLYTCASQPFCRMHPFIISRHSCIIDRVNVYASRVNAVWGLSVPSRDRYAAVQQDLTCPDAASVHFDPFIPGPICSCNTGWVQKLQRIYAAGSAYRVRP